jgi:exopolyphosphatase/guanosine-5'-triphosphate,3'-diphosphate pyrophosphatase
MSPASYLTAPPRVAARSIARRYFSPMRVGVVDLGTNSTRLLVADVDGDRVDEVSRHTVITRLGEGVDERRKLLPLPVARVRNALSDYRRELEQLVAERVLAIGTSAIRDAENGEAFLGEIEWSYGFATRLLSGDEEAELTRRGVTNGRAVDDDTLVLDVGGGSTELITAAERTSIDVGSVRLTERHLRSDPPTREELEAAAQAVRDELPPLDPRDAIGVAGTITTLAALELGGYDPERVHGRGRRLAARAPRLPPTRRTPRAARARARARAGDRRRRDRRPRGAGALRARRARGERARSPPRRRARGREAA